MATIKSHTDLEQSRKLAEFLSNESADQTWQRIAIAGANLNAQDKLQYKHNGDVPFIYSSGTGVPCWSLSALLDILPKSEDKAFDVSYGHYGNDTYIPKWYISYIDNSKNIPFIKMIDGDNLIDIVVQLLIYLKANEQI